MREISRRDLFIAGAGFALTTLPVSAHAQTTNPPMLVYADGLKSNWTTTGWARAELETALEDQKPVQLFMAAWSNFGFHRPDAVRSSDFTTLTLLVRGGDERRQTAHLQLKTGDTAYRSVSLRLERNAWQRCELLIQRQLGLSADDSFDTIEIFNPTANEQPPWFLNYVLLQ
jgi:hypothetical protein